jgi:CRISPR subtype II RNA-guided endonuclease Cas9/Csn1
MKKILGLDLGTTSIGWALIQIFQDGTKRIIKLGSRIVSMDGLEKSFERGEAQTKNAERRQKKGARVGNKRYKQRRNKLIYVLQKLDLLPKQIKTDKPFDNPKKIQKVNVLPIKKNTEQLTGKQFLELRVKALTQAVSREEFGRILYRFNQLRGYAGGEEQDDEIETANILGIEKSTKNFPSQENVIDTFQILGYKATEEKKKKKTIHKLRVKDKNSKIWEGETLVENITVGDSIELKQLIRQNTKTGKITSIDFSIPKKSGWRKQMENLEDALSAHSKEAGRKTYLSEFFLDALKANRWKKIRDNVILRAHYEEEFDAVWEQQFRHHLAKVDKQTITEIASFLFPGDSANQQKFRNEGIEKGLKYIIKNQVIYFQRELKDQSHLISDCRFKSDQKAVAKSHPLFQEYKVWEQINKLSINRKIPNGFTKAGKAKFKYEERPIPSSFKEYLFEQLQFKEELSFPTVFNRLKKGYDFDESVEFFNGMSAKTKLKGNTTRITLSKRLGRFWDILKMDSVENQIEIWKLLYNGKGNEYDLKSNRNKEIAAYLKTRGVADKDFDKVVVAISCIKFPRDYASISLKAVKIVLPLFRAGQYFDSIAIDKTIVERISTILNTNVTDDYDKSLQNYLDTNENEILKSGGFINAYALMLAYGKHTGKTVTEDDILSSFKEIKALERHSLRNPLVEQMINETLMVVKDIWKTYGKPNEIKVELARELKSSIKERSNMYDRMENNQKVNSYIKYRLREINQALTKSNVERYKLWERQENDNPEFVARFESTKNEVEKMRLWEEQGHIDPYTNETIPLSGLFNKGLYDIDHIIPQSRFFDDGLANKVVCSQKVNNDKGNRTAMEYIESGSSAVANLLSPEEFMESVGNRFYGKKRKMLLATKIPEDPIERQKKETQFIAIRVREELAKIVGTKNVKTTTGGVTHYLRNQWGLTDAFKEILKPRFERFYVIKAEKEYEKLKKEVEKEDDELVEKEGEELVDFESFRKRYLKEHIFKKDNNLILKGWSKRYDHRHHAMDALTVALTDEKAVKRLNDLNKHLQDWVVEKSKEGTLNLDPEADDILEQFFQEESNIRTNALKEIERFRNIPIPWDGFKKDAKKALEKIIVSHKPKDKLLLQYDTVVKNGKQVKERVIKIRGPLHEETIYGLSSGIESKRINLSSFAASTMSVSATKTNIEKICNDYLRDVISDHYHNTHNGSKSDAFGAEGIMGLNKRLAEKTKMKNGKEVPAPHPPINSVKIYRKKPKGNGKDIISLQKMERKTSFNDSLYVNTGGNYLFAVLEKDGQRSYDIISLFQATEYLKEKFLSSKSRDNLDKYKLFTQFFDLNNQGTLLFALKILDLVYLPNENEDVILDQESTLFNSYWKKDVNKNQIYVVNKFSGKQIYFTQHTTAEVIEKKIELGSQNMEEFVNGRKVVEYCIPIKLDRLGNIIEVNGNKIS